MTRADFSAIVNSAASAEAEQLKEFVRSEAEGSATYNELLAALIAQIPGITARTCAHILEKSGLISFDD